MCSAPTFRVALAHGVCSCFGWCHQRLWVLCVLSGTTMNTVLATNWCCEDLMISFHDQWTAPHFHHSSNSHSPQCSKLAQLGVPSLCICMIQLFCAYTYCILFRFKDWLIEYPDLEVTHKDHQVQLLLILFLMEFIRLNWGGKIKTEWKSTEEFMVLP